MNKSITALSMTLFLVACGGSGSNNPTTNVAPIAPTLGAAFPEATDTSSLGISQSFSFETARSVDIKIDIETARNEDANVSVCTDYSEVGDEYDIDFNTCTVSGALDNGVFNHSMQVTNDKKSVVAVILFQDAELAPLYKEFTIDTNQRSKADGSVRRVIVWN